MGTNRFSVALASPRAYAFGVGYEGRIDRTPSAISKLAAAPPVAGATLVTITRRNVSVDAEPSVITTFGVTLPVASSVAS